MGEKALSFKTAITPLYLLGACLVIDKMTSYHHPLQAIWIDAAFFFAYCLLVWLAARIHVLVSRQHSFVMAGLLFLALFFRADLFFNLLQSNTALYGFHNRSYLLILIIMCVLTAIAEKAFLVKKPKRYLQLIKAITIFLSLLLAISLANLAWQTWKRPHVPQQHNSFSTGAKNITWMLMDEYASSAVLKQYFGYRNSLDSFLQQREFILLNNISTRFDQTLFSLNAIFNNDDSIQPPDFNTALERLKTSAWTTGLQNEQAPFTNLDFITMGNQPGIQNLYVFPDTYFKQLIYGSVLTNAIARNQYPLIDTYNTQVKTALMDRLQQSPDRPGFIWAHFFIPHQPYLRDATGRLINADKPISAGATLKKYYIDYLQYGNLQIEDILQKDPWLDKRILIISGDHGARFPFINKADRYRPYCAIHFPKNFDTAGLHSIRYISQLPAFIAAHHSRTK